MLEHVPLFWHGADRQACAEAPPTRVARRSIVVAGGVDSILVVVLQGCGRLNLVVGCGLRVVGCGLRLAARPRKGRMPSVAGSSCGLRLASGSRKGGT